MLYSCIVYFPYLHLNLNTSLDSSNFETVVLKREAVVDWLNRLNIAELCLVAIGAVIVRGPLYLC